MKKTSKTEKLQIRKIKTTKFTFFVATNVMCNKQKF